MIIPFEQPQPQEVGKGEGSRPEEEGKEKVPGIGIEEIESAVSDMEGEENEKTPEDLAGAEKAGFFSRTKEAFLNSIKDPEKRKKILKKGAKITGGTIGVAILGTYVVLPLALVGLWCYFCSYFAKRVWEKIPD